MSGLVGRKARALAALGLVLALAGSLPVLASNDGGSGVPTISTLAGTTPPVLTPAEATSLSLEPTDVAASPGRIYATDFSQHVVRAVDLASGIATVVAGTGVYGSSGDGGPATRAALSSPRHLATAPDGTLVIGTDHGLRAVAPDGTISTLTTEASGPVAIGPDGTVFATRRDSSEVVRVSLEGSLVTVAGSGPSYGPSDGTPALEAGFFVVSGLAVSGAGDIYVSDRHAARVFRITGGVVATVAGQPDPGCQTAFYEPCGGFSGDGGPATAGELHGPGALALSGTDLLIADLANHRVRRVDASGSIRTVAGNGTGGTDGDGGPATSAALRYPKGLAVLNADWFVATSYSVRAVDPAQAIRTVAGTGWPFFGGDGGPASAARLSRPADVAALPDGSLLVADMENNRVRRVAPDGAISTFAGGGGYFDLCCDSGGAGDGGPARAAQLYKPGGIAAAPDGVVYIAESNRIRRVAPDGSISTVAGSTRGFAGDGGPAVHALLNRPTGLHVAADGSLLIADTQNQRIRRMDPAGTMTTLLTLPANPVDILETPRGEVFVADPDKAWRVRIDGSLEPLTGSSDPGTATGPNSYANGGQGYSSLAIDEWGRVYFSSYRRHTIRMRNHDGMWRPVAGRVAGFAGDGGPAVDALVRNPSGMAIAGGRLVFADLGNDRVRTFPIGPGELPPEDTAPPVTSVSYPQDPPPWFDGPQVVYLSASDTTGVEYIDYELLSDGGEVARGRQYGNIAGVRLPFEGRNLLRYRAVDRLGKAEEFHEAVFHVDSVDPSADIEVTAEPFATDLDVARTFQVRATCADAGSGCVTPLLVVDGVTRGESVTLEAQGTYAITALARDRAGNEATSPTRRLTVDRTAPEMTLAATSETESHEGWSASGWNLSASCIDAVFARDCSKEYRSAEGAWLPFSDMGLLIDREGVHDVAVRTADPLGNLVSSQVTLKVDRSGPSGTWVTPPTVVSEAWISFEARIGDPVLADGRPGSGLRDMCFDVTLDAGLVEQRYPCSPGTLVDGVWRSQQRFGAGSYRVAARGTDVAGNPIALPPATILVLGPPGL